MYHNFSPICAQWCQPYTSLCWNVFEQNHWLWLFEFFLDFLWDIYYFYCIFRCCLASSSDILLFLLCFHGDLYTFVLAFSETSVSYYFYQFSEFSLFCVDFFRNLYLNVFIFFYGLRGIRGKWAIRVSGYIILYWFYIGNFPCHKIFICLFVRVIVAINLTIPLQFFHYK